MDLMNKQTITLDLRQTTTAPLPQFIQNDTNILEFAIKENGVDVDVSTIDRIVVNYKRPDGVVISRLVAGAGNKVVYEIGSEEMAVHGYGELSIQFFESEDRLSTKRIKVYFAQAIGPLFEKSAGMPLLQELFTEVIEVSESATQSGDYAMEQAGIALAQANYAKAQGDAAASQAANLNTLKANVTTATTNANTATTTANNAASDATAQANYAKAQGDHAKTQGDYAKIQGDAANVATTNATTVYNQLNVLIPQLKQIDNYTLFQALLNELKSVQSWIYTLHKDEIDAAGGFISTGLTE